MDNYKKTIIKDNLNANNNLYKLVDNLKNKLLKLETVCKRNMHVNNQTIISSYRISYPNITKNTKKFVGLLFDQFPENSNNRSNSSSNDVGDSNKLSFIKLKTLGTKNYKNVNKESKIICTSEIY